jgi:hypothetical protein
LPITAHCSAVDSSIRVKVVDASVVVMTPLSHAAASPSTVRAVDVDQLSAVTLPDAAGAPHQLGAYWADRAVILVFLRHFG